MSERERRERMNKQSNKVFCAFARWPSDNLIPACDSVTEREKQKILEKQETNLVRTFFFLDVSEGSKTWQSFKNKWLLDDTKQTPFRRHWVCKSGLSISSKHFPTLCAVETRSSFTTLNSLETNHSFSQLETTIATPPPSYLRISFCNANHLKQFERELTPTTTK